MGPARRAEKRSRTEDIKHLTGLEQNNLARCVSHVVGEFAVEGLDVALATLQLLLKLSEVVVDLIQLP